MLNLLILAGLCRFTDQYGLSTGCFCGRFHALVHHGIDHSYFLMHILSCSRSLQKSTNNAEALSGQVNPMISITQCQLGAIRRTQRDCAGMPTMLPPANVMMVHRIALSCLLVDLKGWRRPRKGALLCANGSISSKFKRINPLKRKLGCRGDPSNNPTRELGMTTRFTWLEKATLLGIMYGIA